MCIRDRGRAPPARASTAMTTIRTVTSTGTITSTGTRTDPGGRRPYGAAPSSSSYLSRHVGHNPCENTAPVVSPKKDSKGLHPPEGSRIDLHPAQIGTSSVSAWTGLERMFRSTSWYRPTNAMNLNTCPMKLDMPYTSVYRVKESSLRIVTTMTTLLSLIHISEPTRPY